MESTLLVSLNDPSFEYDVHALVKAFYPDRNVKVLSGEREENFFAEIEIGEGGARICLEGREHKWQAKEEEKRSVPETRGDFKNGFKAFLYEVLSRETGRKLPWGNLTGIRPTKIAYGMLEQGKNRQEIMDYLEDKHFVSGEKAALSIDIAEREREILSKILCGDKGDSQGYSRDFSLGYSLYVGIPFCPTTCLYCSFTSYPIGGYRKIVDRYVDCLLKELEYVARKYQGKRLDCVYIGGGTPTTLEAEQLDRLLSGIKHFFDFSQVKEFTVEAGRADSITKEKLSVLKEKGVDRISVNPQTMKQETLDRIGRKASVEQVEAAFFLARQMGFDNINMDLILGLPGELAQDVQHTIDRVAELGPDSLTVHSLAVKRASKLNQWIQENGISMLKNTDETMEIAAKGARRLHMEPYYLYRQKNISGNFENVGYARPGKYGLYNILIMEEKQTIIACGAGSISKLVLPDGRIERSSNVKDVTLYIEKIDEMIQRKEAF
ncbi:coproporphyrinogen dehydrogenase HemZ [Candidatus Acetatifactor stercoripullorum]|uniref:coproporphyrinogen dehydrogenase HemZ n=1 Tax=Candidatus Acetatifactor stercoripullorum TaxID=2838414 RepID=UPI00298D85AC|nr:coproporphyrinogen dehydrogenase HemZ [Candidatus Acetatifactor stercoripullorum]